MTTVRSTFERRILAALDASPSRIPVLLGGCGTGRTHLMHHLRERLGPTSSQYVDAERVATTPERFLRAVTSASPFAHTLAPEPSTPRDAFDQTLVLFDQARAAGGGAATFLIDEFLEFRTFESFPGLRQVLQPVRETRALRADGYFRKLRGMCSARPALPHFKNNRSQP